MDYCVLLTNVGTKIEFVNIYDMFFSRFLIDAQRGDADSCLHPPAYFFQQDRRPTSSHKAAPRRATQDIRRQADADRHW